MKGYCDLIEKKEDDNQGNPPPIQRNTILDSSWNCVARFPDDGGVIDHCRRHRFRSILAGTASASWVMA